MSDSVMRVRALFRRRRVAEFALLTLSLAAALVLIELGLWALGMNSPLIWEPDPRLGWRQIPSAHRLWTEEGRGHVQINRLGHRDRERDVARRPETVRIAILGDSMTEAVQVNLEDTFCYRLEDRLSRATASVEVWNLGVSGYSPVQELLLFKELLPRYRVDVVVLALFLDNDVSGMHRQLSVVQSGPPYATFESGAVRFDFQLAEESYGEYHRLPMYWFRRYSGLYRMTSAWRWQTRAARETDRDTAIPRRHLLYASEASAVWEEAWRRLEAVLLEFKAEAERQGIDFVVLSVPTGQLVDEVGWRQFLAGKPAMAAAKWDLEGPERRLTRFAQLHRIDLVSALDAFRKEGAAGPLFFSVFGHMTAEGHRVLARTLGDAFERRVASRSR